MVADVEMRHARFAAERPADVYLAHQPGQFVKGRLGRPVVRDRDLARAYHLVNKDQVVAQRACDRGRGDVVTARPDESRQPFLTKRLCPGQESRHRLRRRVYAETADDGRDAGSGDLAQKDLRRLRTEALFPAPAKQMFVRVDQPRGDKTIAGVDDFEIEAGSLQGAPVNAADLLDPVACEQD